MIDNKKEQERAELHRTIWGITKTQWPIDKRRRLAEFLKGETGVNLHFGLSHHTLSIP